MHSYMHLPAAAQHCGEHSLSVLSIVPSIPIHTITWRLSPYIAAMCWLQNTLTSTQRRHSKVMCFISFSASVRASIYTTQCTITGSSQQSDGNATSKSFATVDDNRKSTRLSQQDAKVQKKCGKKTNKRRSKHLVQQLNWTVTIYVTAGYEYTCIPGHLAGNELGTSGTTAELCRCRRFCCMMPAIKWLSLYRTLVLV